MIPIKTEEELETFIKNNPTSIILKHSTTCPISARAFTEFEAFSKTGAYPAGIILVLESRPASNRLAEISNIKHQSPQVLFCKDGKFDKSLSHHNITQENLKKYIN